MFVQNAPTFLDELQDPDQLDVDRRRWRAWTAGPAHGGLDSPPVFPRVIDRLAELIRALPAKRSRRSARAPAVDPRAYVEVTARALQASV